MRSCGCVMFGFFFLEVVVASLFFYLMVGLIFEFFCWNPKLILGVIGGLFVIVVLMIGMFFSSTSFVD